MAEHNELGKSGEDHASEYLAAKGYSILERNWRHKNDEIDIIAMKSGILIFAEVKTRSSLYFGEPQLFVTKKKQKLTIRAANAYIHAHNLDLEARFDIISVLIANGKVSISHIEDAYYPTL